jgi:DNA-binding transcriptional regulator GbsR (MarR family)
VEPSGTSPADRRTDADGRLPEARRLFIERWTRMAASWGVPRSMAEVHALLFVEGRPLGAEDLITRLGISRGNASMTLRTLVEWGIVRKEVVPGSRRELFVAEQDVLSLFATVMRVRKEREVDPLCALVAECRAACGVAGAGHEDGLAEFRRKLDDIEMFVRASDRLMASLLAEGGDGLREFLRHSEARP